MSPPIPPIRELILAIVKRIDGWCVSTWNTKINKGTSFCQVIKIRHIDHDNEDITAGNQKWHGASPSLKARAKIIISREKYSGFVVQENRLLKRRSEEPITCAIKYLTAASVWRVFNEEKIKGIKENIFNSSPNQIIIQLELEMEIREPRIKVEEKRKIWGSIENNIINFHDHSRDPSFHSWRSPKIKIRIKNNLLTNAVVKNPVVIIKGRGNKRIISMSNTKKITAVKKNRKEKGSRAFFTGSNPHSYGESFSRDILIRKFKIHATKNTKEEIKNAKKTRKEIKNMFL